MFNPNIRNFFDLPCNVYVRDFDGNMLDCNDIQAINSGFTQASDLIGCNDKDLLDEKTALIVRNNDLEIRDNGLPKTFLENVIVNNKSFTFLCNKIPLFNFKKKIIGIFGTAVRVDNPLCNIDASIFQYPGNPFDNLAINNINVSRREKECLHYLIQGLSAKGIARKLNLSARTVEYYIDRMKEKYACKNKIELIIKAISQL